VLLWFILCRGCGWKARSLWVVGDQEGDVADAASLDAFYGCVVDAEIPAGHAAHGEGEDAEKNSNNEHTYPSTWA
jgi:hypothetical protein